MEVGGWVQVSLGSKVVFENHPKIALIPVSDCHFGVVYHLYSVCTVQYIGIHC